MLAFDNFGNLTPDQPIVSDLSEVEQTFVFNEHRRHLFETFVEFLGYIQSIGVKDFELWIDGSFATRKHNPMDIDLVFFLDYRDYQTHQKTIGDFRDAFATRLDVYFVAVYPSGHPFFVRTQFDRVEYLHLFSRDRSKKRKGFVQIHF